MSAAAGAVAVRAEPAPHAAPRGFRPHSHEMVFEIGAPRARVWGWLEDPHTFTDSQVWPYRVEFVSADPETPAGFHEGGLNIHHGPFLHLPGTLAEIREGSYRDLRYFYGSHVVSPRWVRPTRLEFWVEDAGDAATRVRLRLSSFVRAPLVRVWSAAQAWFWRRFPRWMSRSLRAPLRADRESLR